MSFALLFAGQGTQHAAMLPWLETDSACASALAAMQARVGEHWRAGLDDPLMRSSNHFAQPLITGTSLAAWAGVQAALSALPAARDLSGVADATPAVVAGYSVGELAAFACAAIMDVPSAIDWAVRRAQMMDDAVAGLDTGLLSVSAVPVVAVLALDARLDCAIALAADHAIYAAESSVLEHCTPQLRERGGVCKRLDVRVASHSRFMASAASAFATHLQQEAWTAPVCPVVLNASGASTRQRAALQDGLARQICSTVQWASCMDAVAEKGVRCVMEIGAGSALSAMWNARYPGIAARALEDFRDAAGAARWIARHLEV